MVALVVALALCVAFLVPRAGDIAVAFTRQDPLTLVAALVVGAIATYLTFLSWRALMAGAGHRLPLAAAQRVFFLSQIGKYVPGSVWPIVAQADLGREHKVPAARSVAVGLLTLLVSCGAGVCVAAATIPFVQPDAFARYWFVVLLVPIVLAALHPAVLRFALRTAARVTRRDLGTIDLRLPAIARAFVWAVLAWIVFGAHIVLVLVPIGHVDLRVVLLTIGAYALAWLVGFLVFFLPAGLGGREAVLTALLVAGAGIGSSAAVSVAVMSRVLLTVVDVVFAGSAVLGERHHRRRKAG
ncbi:lysylphosphatidylglycerol synthase domain-containing protein [Curtobacterium flaccumfaciens]|nr:lysylphosphatidylglycerol synthase domain-containing protein [Curtobacterium flaccumfaciens]